jgi:Tfp pilus assembly protein PilN
MIRINLLPEGYTKSDRTPLGRFALVAGCMMGVLTSLAVFGFEHFGKLREINAQRETTASELAALKNEEAYADALQREKDDFRKRSETIQSIGHSRILWTKKLDQFLDVVDAGGDRERHFIWLRSLDVKPGHDGQGADRDGGTLQIKGYSGGQHLQRLSDFHADLKRPPFFDDFFDIDDPSGKVVEFDGEAEPHQAWEFDMKMRLKPRDVKDAKGASPANGSANKSAKKS